MWKQLGRIVTFATAAIIVVWVISFGTFWMVRSGCAGNMTQVHCNGSALVEWYGNLVMLGWVDKYQTLMTGVLALGAGATVVWATRMTIVESRNVARRSRNGEIRAAMTQMRASFILCAATLQRKDYDQSDSPLPLVQLLAPQIAKLDTAIAETLLLSAHYVDKIIRLKTPSQDDLNTARAHCIAVVGFLVAPRSFFTSGGLFKPKRLTSAQLDEHLTKNGFHAKMGDEVFAFRSVIRD